MSKWARGKAYWAIPAGIVVVFAVLVFLAFGVSHTKTKVVTVTKKVTAPAPKFDGTLSSLVGFLHPKQAQGAKCPAGFPPDAKCFIFTSDRWYVDAALPGDAAAS